MCYLSENLKEKKVIGYKVALKKDDKYFSPAMGFEYTVGPVPIVEKQIALTGNFSTRILEEPITFETNMVGRTALFATIASARKFANTMLDYTPGKYIVCIITMKLEGGLMGGVYGSADVVAGRSILEIKEVAICGRGRVG